MESGRTKRENGGERFSFFLASDFCFVYEWGSLFLMFVPV
jgi:hypothetical protein